MLPEPGYVPPDHTIEPDPWSVWVYGIGPHIVPDAVAPQYLVAAIPLLLGYGPGLSHLMVKLGITTCM